MINLYDVPAYLLLGVALGITARYLHLHYKAKGMERLYINEIKCPNCGARPNRSCIGKEFDGQRFPYTCIGRWFAVDKENERREVLREQSSRTDRR